jgi:hypothetical protein
MIDVSGLEDNGHFLRESAAIESAYESLGVIDRPRRTRRRRTRESLITVSGREGISGRQLLREAAKGEVASLAQILDSVGVPLSKKQRAAVEAAIEASMDDEVGGDVGNDMDDDEVGGDQASRYDDDEVGGDLSEDDMDEDDAGGGATDSIIDDDEMDDMDLGDDDDDDEDDVDDDDDAAAERRVSSQLDDEVEAGRRMRTKPKQSRRRATESGRRAARSGRARIRESGSTSAAEVAREAAAFPGGPAAYHRARRLIRQQERAIAEGRGW